MLIHCPSGFTFLKNTIKWQIVRFKTQSNFKFIENSTNIIEVYFMLLIISKIYQRDEWLEIDVFIF